MNETQIHECIVSNYILKGVIIFLSPFQTFCLSNHISFRQRHIRTYIKIKKKTTRSPPTPTNFPENIKQTTMQENVTAPLPITPRGSGRAIHLF